jgi:hypothetical protein
MAVNIARRGAIAMYYMYNTGTCCLLCSSYGITTCPAGSPIPSFLCPCEHEMATTITGVKDREFVQSAFISVVYPCCPNRWGGFFLYAYGKTIGAAITTTPHPVLRLCYRPYALLKRDATVTP